jgi:hypothetical protein
MPRAGGSQQRCFLIAMRKESAKPPLLVQSDNRLRIGDD